MLQRQALSQIESWARTKTHQGLLITGARQVGITTAVRAYAQNRYDTFAETKFPENPSAVALISKARSAEDLLLRISALTNKELSAGKALVFSTKSRSLATYSHGQSFLPSDRSTIIFFRDCCSELSFLAFGHGLWASWMS